MLTIKIDKGTVSDHTLPTTTGDALYITCCDAKRKLDDLRSGYEGLLHQMMPLVKI